MCNFCRYEYFARVGVSSLCATSLLCGTFGARVAHKARRNASARIRFDLQSPPTARRSALEFFSVALRFRAPPQRFPTRDRKYVCSMKFTSNINTSSEMFNVVCQFPRVFRVEFLRGEFFLHLRTNTDFCEYFNVR